MSDSPIRPDDGDRTHERAMVELGSHLLVRLWALIKTARTHDVANQAFQRQLQECLAVIHRGMEEEQELALAAVSEYFYLNGVRLKVHASLLSLYHALKAEFERRSLGGLRFLQGLSPAEFERFFQLFVAADNPGLAEHLIQAVEEASIQHVLPIDASEIDQESLERELLDQPESERGRAKKSFWRAVLGTQRLVLRATHTGRPDLRHAKRLVQPVVDNIMNHEYSIVGLTALKDHDEYTYAHCVNVSILSMSMGHLLGFPRQALADLGVAALVHDIGKIAIPGDVLRKPGALSPEEWQMMRRHPLEGVRMMVRMPGLSMLAVHSMRSCLEHHMNYDRTGYPDVEGAWGQAAMSRIVAVADCFDAMTAHRSYDRRPASSFEAVQYFLGPNRVRFDPAVLWALVRTVGLYPPGSVMLTESRHVVLSVTPNPDDLRRPQCRIMVHPDGRVEPEDSATIWDPMPANEHVVRVLPPEEQVVPTSGYLAA